MPQGSNKEPHKKQQTSPRLAFLLTSRGLREEDDADVPFAAATGSQERSEGSCTLGIPRPLSKFVLPLRRGFKSQVWRQGVWRNETKLEKRAGAHENLTLDPHA